MGFHSGCIAVLRCLVIPFPTTKTAFALSCEVHNWKADSDILGKRVVLGAGVETRMCDIFAVNVMLAEYVWVRSSTNEKITSWVAYVVFRVMTEQNFITFLLCKHLQKLCVYLPCYLFRWYAAEQYVLYDHAAIIENMNASILEYRLIFFRQVQFVVAEAHHHRGNLRCFSWDSSRRNGLYCE